MATNPEFFPGSYNQDHVRSPFEFSLEGHQLVDPETNRGHVVSVEEVAPISETGVELPVTMYEMGVADPFVQADPAGYNIVKNHIQGMEAAMLEDGFDFRVEGHRTEAIKRSKQNQYTNQWLAQPDLYSLQIWRDLVPTAEALGYLTKPYIDSIIANRKGETAVISPETAAHLRFVEDAVGIRDRAVAFTDIAINHLNGYTKGSDIKWASLAGGTAEPGLLAAKHVQNANGLNVDFTVADLDDQSLKYVERNAEAIGFQGKVHALHQNILIPNLAEEMAARTGQSGQFDVVEATGFVEYLPQEGDELQAFKGQSLPQAGQFIKTAYGMVKPGGILMAGNMVLSQREQLTFLHGIVDWPLINARSEESMVRTYDHAGVVADPNSQLSMYRVIDDNSGSHVYTISTVSKAA